MVVEVAPSGAAGGAGLKLSCFLSETTAATAAADVEDVTDMSGREGPAAVCCGYDGGGGGCSERLVGC